MMKRGGGIRDLGDFEDLHIREVHIKIKHRPPPSRMLILLNPLGLKQIHRNLPIQSKLMSHHNSPSDIIPGPPAHRRITDESV